MDFRKEVVKLLEKQMKLKDVASLIEVPPDPKMGDFAFPCFVLSKELKKAPEVIVQELKEKLIPNKYIIGITSVGPYLNFHVNKVVLAEEILGRIYKEKQAYGKGEEKQVILVESPGPNTNKPLHLGHIRNLCLGQTIINLFKHAGNKTYHVDIVNDRGIHVCKSMLAYAKWGKNKEPDIKPDHFVGKYYVLFNERAREDSSLEKEARELLLKWEEKDSETIKLWKKMNNWVYKGFEQTYERFKVKFDKIYYESEHFEGGKELIQEGLRIGVFHKDEDGSVYVDLRQHGLTRKVLLRADGTSVYVTQDLNLAKKRYEDFKFDKCIYVVASEQIFHFQTLFKVLELLKFKFDLYHLAYGMINLASGKMKSREGKVVDADEIVEELKKLAFTEIKKKHPNINYKEIQRRAEIIGISALRFFMLKYDALKDFTYNPEESIAFEGETGPYVQYVYARISSILRKFGKKINKKIDYSLLREVNEQRLVMFLNKFPKVINDTKENYNPSMLTRYLLDLCQAFNEYYHDTPILKAEEKVRDARLMLIFCIKEVVKLGLNLLKIDVLEEM